jgi:hypothetical protein
MNGVNQQRKISSRLSCFWIQGAGMPTLPNNVVHPVVTKNHGYQYQFTTKHHGGNKSEAQWDPELTLNEEFAVFDEADQANLLDKKGNLYGAVKVGADDLRILGTRGEQVAEFPAPSPPSPWHGYPAFPLEGSNHEAAPPREVLTAMMKADIITKRGRRRLAKGDRV